MNIIEELSRKRNRLRQKVLSWVSEEAERGNLRTNYQAPGWKEYIAAERELSRAVEQMGKK